jgi:hypothetical protein
MRLLWLLVLAAVSLLSEAPAQITRFDLRDPAEASQWIVQYHDESSGPPIRDNNGITVRGRDGNNVAIMRDVQIAAANYNRLFVRLHTQATPRPGGFAAAAVFFNNGPTADIIPESLVTTMFAPGQETVLAFQLTESLLWSGQITRVRVDPLWGEGTATVKEVWFGMEDTRRVPSWDFTTVNGAAGWTFGEFTPDLKASSVTYDESGATWTTTTPERMMQQMGAQFETQSVSALRIELRSNVTSPTDLRFFWSNVNPARFSPGQAIVVPIQPSSDWQRIEIPLTGHPGWKGLVRALIVNPGLLPGTVSVRRMAFVDSGASPAGLGRLDSVRWITPEQASAEIQAGNGKPLMVLLTKDGNDFSRRIESQLNADPAFAGGSTEFHCVRMQATDPRVPKLFGRIYRIPVLVFKKWDQNKRQWLESARLEGADVSAKSTPVMASSK